MNEYEQAVERFNRISEDFSKIVEHAEAIIAWANDEYANAQANLAQYESKPGIPLPQYQMCPGGC